MDASVVNLSPCRRVHGRRVPVGHLSGKYRIDFFARASNARVLYDFVANYPYNATVRGGERYFFYFVTNGNFACPSADKTRNLTLPRPRLTTRVAHDAPPVNNIVAGPRFGDERVVFVSGPFCFDNIAFIYITNVVSVDGDASDD